MDEEEWSKEQEANRKPGQKHPTPSPGFADRVFYESLLQQRPDSKMAKKWCVEYGVLDWDQAEKLCKELGIAIRGDKKEKATPIKKMKTVVKKASLKAVKVVDDAVDPGLSVGGGVEGVGFSEL